MPITAIIFDLGQVLDAPADPEEAQERREIMAARLGLDTSELWTYLFEGEQAQRWMTGKITEEQFWREVLGTKGIKDPHEIEDFASKAFADTGKMNAEMAALIEELRDRYLLAVLSNTSWTEDELKRMLSGEMGLPPDTFDVVVTSKSVGTTKPDPRIYRAALERLGVKPEEAIFTDDLANFTDAAAGLGINVFTFNTPAGFREYLEGLGIL